jgi:predicted DCC family thiol-disulfide oxidoreductase YuxK/chromate transport protein ChrA
VVLRVIGMPRTLLAYDAHCEPCTRFRNLVHFIDSKGEIEFISLVDAEDAGLLEKVPKAERHTSFHLILPDGRLLTGAEAVPTLLELLPGGKMLSRVITSAPGGPLVISTVYDGFARGHDGSACALPRPVASSENRLSQPVAPSSPTPGPSRSTYFLAGVFGGFFGSLAMGFAVHLPDALCLVLATAIVGRSPSTYALAWGFHVFTAMLIGAAFGILASFLRIGDGAPLSRGLLLGLSTGGVVWAGFFTPLMLTFLPSLVTRSLLESSFVAHALFGLVLGLTLVVMLRLRRGLARET